MRTVEELCKPGSDKLAIPTDARAADAIRIFQDVPGLKILPVITSDRRPVGAVFEEDIRQILFNPYGHALLRNPSFGHALGDRIRPCPTADVGQPLGELLSAYAEADGQAGMIITRDGRYHGVIENRELVQAAGAYEFERIRQREAQLNRLREVGRAFERDIDDLARGLASVANELDGTATATAERGEATGQRAQSVATAAAQTSQTMELVASHSHQLVAALRALHNDSEEAKASAHAAVDLVMAGTRRAANLRESIRSIEAVTDLIDQMAGRVRLLAINATIEAARAGEAGRGFAVVASEVRSLAAQTAAAADDIRRHATDVQGAVEDVVRGHDGIENVVTSVERIAQSVEATVQAQHGLTQDIAAGAVQAASASTDILANVEDIRSSAQAAAHGSTRMVSTAQTLADASRRLSRRVLSFMADLSFA